ncbi:DUF2812 domain-containing protein [Streptococcus moroccensis]|uniref:DUF2812 domain-containing protein n=1 Tax=Streptococcus moroccensis TaxID=1451356 RepID=A0ABT9YRY9_9STRE|nr:DUF2812 domain-containing protein [Streptococcus moroccensis]MDQ0222382.1 hypothetical protein [Streptococcus moroccensis]
MKKYKLFADPSQEESWIDAIQAQGYQLVKVEPWRFRYEFEPTTSPKPIRIDYRDFYSSRSHKEYVTFFEDAGWKHLAGVMFGGQQYFVQEGQTPDTEIFSDWESKKAMKKRMLDGAISTGSACVLYVAIMMGNKGIHLGDYLIPSRWFMAEGLWQMPKDLMWKAVLFELPFALLRVLPFYLFLGMAIFYSYRYVKVSRTIKKGV